jgi:rubrerythrin
MHSMTVSNLQSAFSGESQAHMRYLAYAAKAERDGFPNVARLFKAVSWAEQIHATSHFTVLRGEVGPALTVAGGGFGLGSTADNLAVAIEGEQFEIEEMYPVYKASAEYQGERSALRSMDWAGEAEKTHYALYQEAKEAVEAGNDLELEQIWVCERCGHTVLDEAPDQCPICKAKQEAYQAF